MNRVAIMEAMGRIRCLAANTFKEAVRDRVLYLVGVLGIFFVLSGKMIGWISVGLDVKVVRDIGLSSINFFGALIAIFVGTGLIQKEIGGRTIYTILARPVARYEFILGKYLGLLATVFSAVAGLIIVFLINLVIVTEFAPGIMAANGAIPAALGGAIWQQLALTLIELMVVTSIAVFFSALSTPILSAVFTFLVYIAGQFAISIQHLSDIVAAPEANTFVASMARFFLGVVYRLLPNLDLFNIRRIVTHGDMITSSQFGYSIFYGIFYTCFVISLSCALFKRRDLN